MLGLAARHALRIELLALELLTLVLQEVEPPRPLLLGGTQGRDLAIELAHPRDLLGDGLAQARLVGVGVDEIGDDASLISDLNLDSIQMLSLITGMESQFNIMLDEEDLDLENLSSVNKLAEFVQKKLG